MACMGPSKEYAYLEGEKAFEGVLATLKEVYGVRAPMIPPDIDVEGDSPMGLNIRRSMINRAIRDKEEWDENMEKLKTLIQEIVWADHANGF